MDIDASTWASRYLDDLAEEIEEFPNPEIRLRALTEELETLPNVIVAVARMRRELLHAMRDNGFTVQQIADAMGKSRARVYELLVD